VREQAVPAADAHRAELQPADLLAALCLDGDASDAAGEDRFAVLLLDRDGDPVMRLGHDRELDVAADGLAAGGATVRRGESGDHGSARRPVRVSDK
jgi:hypothetical protein